MTETSGRADSESAATLEDLAQDFAQARREGGFGVFSFGGLPGLEAVLAMPAFRQTREPLYHLLDLFEAIVSKGDSEVLGIDPGFASYYRNESRRHALYNRTRMPL